MVGILNQKWVERWMVFGISYCSPIVRFLNIILRFPGYDLLFVLSYATMERLRLVQKCVCKSLYPVCQVYLKVCLRSTPFVPQKPLV